MSLVTTMKSRHVIVALLVAPLLAVFAWFSVGWIAGDTSEAAKPVQAGADYPLIERSGCRYAGGECRLENTDVKWVVTVDDNHVVTIQSAIPLDSLVVGLRSQPSVPPVAAAAAGEGVGSSAGLAGDGQIANDKVWLVRLAGAPDSSDALRLVATAGGARYYGEASLTFTDPAEDYR